MSNWGGAREGAGREKKDNVKIAIRISQEAFSIINNLSNEKEKTKSEIINNLILNMHKFNIG